MWFFKDAIITLISIKSSIGSLSQKINNKSMDSRTKKINSGISNLFQFYWWTLLIIMIFAKYQIDKTNRKIPSPKIIPECRVLSKNNYCIDTCECEKLKKNFIVAFATYASVS